MLAPVILFVIAGSAYLVSFGIIHLLMPRLEPALIDERDAQASPG